MNQKEDFTIDVFIEIPKGSRNKYEYDYKRKMIRYDRMIFSSMHYPSDYGFFMETLGEDGDALDAMVLVSEPTFPGCVIEVRPIGVFYMTDEKGPDAKILCVPMSDPIWNKIFSLEEINPHLKNEIEHFFQVYKDLEKKKVGIEGWGNKQEALELIQQAKDRYEQQKTVGAENTL